MDEREILAKEMIATFQRWIDEGDGDNALAAISKKALALIRPHLRPKAKSAARKHPHS